MVSNWNATRNLNVYTKNSVNNEGKAKKMSTPQISCP